jgi:hypothetical protein
VLDYLRLLLLEYLQSVENLKIYQNQCT